VLERDAAKRAKLYAALQAEFRKTSPFVMLYQHGKWRRCAPTSSASARADGGHDVCGGVSKR